jgi:hypothetical protein
MSGSSFALLSRSKKRTPPVRSPKKRLNMLYCAHTWRSSVGNMLNDIVGRSAEDVLGVCRLLLGNAG